MKYNVLITFKNSHSALLSHRGKTSWRKRTAKKHRDEYLAKNPELVATIQEA